MSLDVGRRLAVIGVTAVAAAVPGASGAQTVPPVPGSQTPSGSGW